MSQLDVHPVAIIGAGPIGLAAAARLIAKGRTPVVLEAADRAGANVLAWGHVRMFSPWQSNLDPTAAALLAHSGWRRPPDAEYPTGRDLVEQYLTPLSALPQIAANLQTHARVIAVGRRGLDRMRSEGRDKAPFVVRVASNGTERDLEASAVLDASGTLSSPNPLGANGIPALGERALGARIFYGLPDVLGLHRPRYVGRRVLVVGSGHSAFNVLLDLVELRRTAPDTTITWAVRRHRFEHLLQGQAADPLPERGWLRSRVRELIERNAVRLVSGFTLFNLTDTHAGIVAASDAISLPPVDEIVAVTGFRPDLSMLTELRLSLDPVIESPAVLAPLIDPNVHSCSTVPPHGADELRHPEQDFYVVGMKSYGRAPTFLLQTGYEQVRSVVGMLTGDHNAARHGRRGGPLGCSPDPVVGTCCSTAPPGTLTASTDTCASVADDESLPRQASASRSGGCCG